MDVFIIIGKVINFTKTGLREVGIQYNNYRTWPKAEHATYTILITHKVQY
jgi:hypothetical protein